MALTNTLAYRNMATLIISIMVSETSMLIEAKHFKMTRKQPVTPKRQIPYFIMYNAHTSMVRT
jgi:hypothetical protein